MRFDEEIHAGFRACRRGIWAVGLFSLALNLLMLTQPLYMTQVYDRVLSSRSEETLLMLTIVAVGALAIIGILEIVRQIVLMRTGARLETALGGRMLDASLQTAQRGGPDVQGLRDLSQLRQFISSPLVSVLFDAPVAPFYFALLYIIHPHLGWLFLGAAVLLVLVSWINQKLTKASAGGSLTALHGSPPEGADTGAQCGSDPRHGHVLQLRRVLGRGQCQSHGRL